MFNQLSKKGVFFTFIAILFTAVFMMMAARETSVIKLVPAASSISVLSSNAVMRSISTVYFPGILEISAARAVKTILCEENRTGKFIDDFNNTFHYLVLNGRMPNNIIIKGASATAIAGDWDGDGIDNVGIVLNGNQFYLRDSLSSGTADINFTYGGAGDTPTTGDWDGNGRTEIGSISGNIWTIDYNGDHVFFGDPGYNYGTASNDPPVTGDWYPDGKDELGTLKSNTKWFLDFDSDYAPGGYFNYGNSPFTPLTGDWDGNGTVEIGTYKNGIWNLSFNLSEGSAPTLSYLVAFGGGASDVPITGDWDASGKTSIGIYNKNTGVFYLRKNTTSADSQNYTFNISYPGIRTPCTDRYMENYSLNELIFRLENSTKANLNAILKIKIIALTFLQEDPWFIIVKTDMTMNMSSPSASWFQNSTIDARVPIEGMLEPMVMVYTNGQYFNRIIKRAKKPWYIADLTEFRDHIANMTFYENPLAPSFIMRMQNSTGASECCGISTLMNPQRISWNINTNQSYVDYLYLTKAYQDCIGGSLWNITNISGDYPPFKMDLPHVNLYNISENATLACN